MSFLVVALQSEARPLIRHFGLSGTDAPAPYRLYRGESVTLVVSGVGRVASAAATAYAFAHEGEPRDRVWINVGIAGHASAALGSARLAHKILDRSTGRAWYPSLVFEPPVPTADLVTVDQPELGLSGDALYDMEASAFFAIASRFSVVELIQVFKVVSDNRAEPISKIDRSLVTRLIEGRMDEIDRLVAETAALADRLVRPAPFPAEWTRNRRFTVSQERRLCDLLQRLAVVEGKPVAAAEFGTVRTAKEILAVLESRVRLSGSGY